MAIGDSNLEGMFTLESDKGGVVEEAPFRILVLGDWSGHGEKRELKSRKPVSIDRDNFDDVIAKLGTSLNLELGEERMPISLKFEELDDFHPDRIFAQVPMFAELRGVRKRLKNQETFFDAAHEVRSWMPEKEEARPEPPPAADAEAAAEPAGDLLSQILSQPGGGAVPIRSSVTQSPDLNRFLKDIVSPHLVRVDENEQSQLVSAVDAATGALMRQIIHNHRFQELEAAWRGLFMMVRRIETDSDLSIHLLDITHDELAADLKGASSLADTLLYRVLITEGVETPGADPWSLVLGNYAFLPDVDDIATLARVSKLAAGADAPFISHIRPDVLGIKSLHENTEPRGWDMSTNSTGGKLWAALRGMPESEYLGLTMPRFLARLPYGSDTEPLEAFFFEEFEDAPQHDKYLWSNAAFVCGLLLAQSFRSYGWEMGRALKQDLEGLPVHVYKEAGETIYKPCAEVQLTDIGCNKLMEYGLMPLVSYKNTDHVKVARFHSATDPVEKLKARWN